MTRNPTCNYGAKTVFKERMLRNLFLSTFWRYTP